jgi:A nuclease of the HNH/ENDO VII superfamily with conserved LHH
MYEYLGFGPGTYDSAAIADAVLVRTESLTAQRQTKKDAVLCDTSFKCNTLYSQMYGARNIADPTVRSKTVVRLLGEANYVCMVVYSTCQTFDRVDQFFSLLIEGLAFIAIFEGALLVTRFVSWRVSRALESLRITAAEATEVEAVARSGPVLPTTFAVPPVTPPPAPAPGQLPSSGWRQVQVDGKTTFQNDQLFNRNYRSTSSSNTLNLTNDELMARGCAPFANDDTLINLHHGSGTDDSVIFELPSSYHQANYNLVHVFPRGTALPAGWPRVDRSAFGKWRTDSYWPARAIAFGLSLIAGSCR